MPAGGGVTVAVAVAVGRGVGVGPLVLVSPRPRIIQLPGKPKESIVPKVAVGKVGGLVVAPVPKPTNERPCEAPWSMAAGN